MADQVMSRLNGSAAQVRLSRTNPPRRLTMLGGGSAAPTYHYRNTDNTHGSTATLPLPAGAVLEWIGTS